jgi:hypothetical protein
VTAAAAPPTAFVAYTPSRATDSVGEEDCALRMSQERLDQYVPSFSLPTPPCFWFLCFFIYQPSVSCSSPFVICLFSFYFLKIIVSCSFLYYMGWENINIMYWQIHASISLPPHGPWSLAGRRRCHTRRAMASQATSRRRTFSRTVACVLLVLYTFIFFYFVFSGIHIFFIMNYVYLEKPCFVARAGFATAGARVSTLASLVSGTRTSAAIARCAGTLAPGMHVVFASFFFSITTVRLQFPRQSCSDSFAFSISSPSPSSFASSLYWMMVYPSCLLCSDHTPRLCFAPPRLPRLATLPRARLVCTLATRGARRSTGPTVRSRLDHR